MATRIIPSQFSAAAAKCSTIFNYTGSYQLPICKTHSEYSTFERTSNQLIKTTVNSRYSNYKQLLWNPLSDFCIQGEGDREGLAAPWGQTFSFTPYKRGKQALMPLHTHTQTHPHVCTLTHMCVHTHSTNPRPLSPGAVQAPVRSPL